MRIGLTFLIAAYCLSQFFRAFLAVLAPVLTTDLGATTIDLATASGLWFATFALMQLPVGWALDTLGPRRTASALFILGAVGGCATFALAQGPGGIILAMALIGIGCSPILMATYYIFARTFSAAVFGTLAGVTVGVSSLGNILSAAPLAWVVDSFGWRETLWATTGFTLVVALGILLFLRDPPKPEGEARGSFVELLRIRALWPIYVGMFICYAPTAGIRGLWISPYVSEVFDATLQQVGFATLAMGLAMVAGNFLYGVADRFGSRKGGILLGNALVAVLCLAFFVVPPATFGIAVAMFVAIGTFGASYPAVMAHGRGFLPSHLTGRGVSLMNLFGMGGAGVMQFASGPTHGALSGSLGPIAAYGALFAIFGVAILLGLAVYAMAKERPA
ncbi:MFS transporter [Rhodobacteraceae bacterium N5(2021)]|uniref:MFS transporter n=1 Tax=Gymnodinialimonas phycosphaerae TaxID=2841589 RepID=A0A975YEX9_9RHOB|nr:MFS transporter [Gymnodinialimonas phycosphaerae]MBY4894192.1 MFS transporter [Gymnodinialimonas phycosphaerae]